MPIPLWRRRVASAVETASVLPLYASFALLKHVVSLPRLARWAWSNRGGTRSAAAEERVLAAVMRAGHLTSARKGDCLHRSLTLYRLLSKIGADPVLVVGFRSSAGAVQGHAWVVVDGQAVADRPNGQVFEPALRFGPEGRLITTSEVDASARANRPGYG